MTAGPAAWAATMAGCLACIDYAAAAAAATEVSPAAGAGVGCHASRPCAPDRPAESSPVVEAVAAAPASAASAAVPPPLQAGRAAARCRRDVVAPCREAPAAWPAASLPAGLRCPRLPNGAACLQARQRDHQAPAAQRPAADPQNLQQPAQAEVMQWCWAAASAGTAGSSPLAVAGSVCQAAAP